MRQFEVRYGFELAEDITIPAGSELRFVGGSISGAHTLTGNKTSIVAGENKIFHTDVIFGGTWNLTEIDPSWFGLNPNDSSIDASVVISYIINNIIDKVCGINAWTAPSTGAKQYLCLQISASYNL